MKEIHFQGDIMVSAMHYDEYAHASRGEKVNAKLTDGSIIVSEGEGKDHFHVARGENIEVKEMKQHGYGDDVRVWSVFAPSGGTLSHVKPDGSPTKDHGDVAIPVGGSVLTTQREQSYVDQETVRSID